MTHPVRIAVVGVGYFGRLHAAKVAALDGAELVAVADLDHARAEEVAAALGTRAVTDYRDLVGQVDAVAIAVPTMAHFEVARAFLDDGAHVLLEKPMTEDAATARALIELAEKRGRVLQIGHLPRFSAAILAIRDKIFCPLYIESDRIAPFKPRGTDVSVILDLMIHDIDLILSLVNAPIESVDAIGTPVLSDSEDIANARIKFANGCVAAITASRVSTKAERKMRIFQPDCYIGVDFLDRTVKTVRKTGGTAASGLPNIEIENETYEEADELAKEIESFVTALTDGTPPLVSGEDGLKALEAAIMIDKSLREHWRHAAAAMGLRAPTPPLAPGGRRDAAV